MPRATVFGIFAAIFALIAIGCGGASDREKRPIRPYKGPKSTSKAVQVKGLEEAIFGRGSQWVSCELHEAEEGGDESSTQHEFTFTQGEGGTISMTATPATDGECQDLESDKAETGVWSYEIYEQNSIPLARHQFLIRMTKEDEESIRRLSFGEKNLQISVLRFAEVDDDKKSGRHKKDIEPRLDPKPEMTLEFKPKLEK